MLCICWEFERYLPEPVFDSFTAPRMSAGRWRISSHLSENKPSALLWCARETSAFRYLVDLPFYPSSSVSTVTRCVGIVIPPSVPRASRHPMMLSARRSKKQGNRYSQQLLRFWLHISIAHPCVLFAFLWSTLPLLAFDCRFVLGM